MKYAPLAITALLASACMKPNASPLPRDLPVVSSQVVNSWVRATRPGRSLYLGMKGARDCEFTDQYGASKSCTALMMLAGSDSMRFDFRFGSIKRGGAFVVGDSAIWARPEEDVKSIVPSYPLLWAMAGIARPPVGAQEIRGLSDSLRTSWRYTEAGDTVTYVRELGRKPSLTAYVSRGGKAVGRVVTNFGPDGRPKDADLLIMHPTSRLHLRFGTIRDSTFHATDWEWN